MKPIIKKKKNTGQQTYIHTHAQDEKKKKEVSSVGSHNIIPKVKKKKRGKQTYIDTHTHKHEEKKKERLVA